MILWTGKEKAMNVSPEMLFIDHGNHIPSNRQFKTPGMTGDHGITIKLLVAGLVSGGVLVAVVRMIWMGVK